MDDTLRAARLLGRAGRWDAAIRLAESVPAAEGRLVAALIAVDSYLFTGRDGVAELLDRAREAVGETPEWTLAQARYRYGVLLFGDDRDEARCRAVVDRFAELARSLPDPALRAWARFFHATSLDVLFEDHEAARAEWAEVRAGAEPFLLSYCLRHLAFYEFYGTGNRTLAWDLTWQSLTLRLACGALPEAAAQLQFLAQIRQAEGEFAQARRLAEQAAAIAGEIGISGPIRAAIDAMVGQPTV
ncbi:MAG: hypothetical protein E6F99_14985 [Actinobacteria bacterium]|nr:MAG: hypothetical protein E6F99_14985 [Actinomycetota bacterium]